MIPEELKEYIKRVVAFEVSTRLDKIDTKVNKQAEEIKSLKTEIAILKEGGNI